MPKILYLTSLDPVPKPGYGGPGRVIENLLSAFQRSGRSWSASVIAKIPAPSGRGGEVGRAFFGRVLPEWLLRPARRVKWQLKGEGFINAYSAMLKARETDVLAADVVHAHDIYAAIALRRLGGAAGAKPLCLSVHAPVSTSAECAEHSPDFVKVGHIAWIREREREALKTADCVVAPSNWALGAIREEFGGFKNSRVLYNCISAERPTRSGRIRTELGLGASDVLVSSLGRLVPEKGFLLFIEAFKKAREISRAKVFGVIAGSGPEEIRLAGAISKAGLQGCFRLLGHRQDAADILADSDVFISSSVKAAFDLGLLEAMRAGLPIIASNSGGNPEALGDGAAGLLFPSRDTAAAASAISMLVSDPERRKTLAEASARHFFSNYSLDILSSRAAAIYGELLPGISPGGKA